MNQTQTSSTPAWVLYFLAPVLGELVIGSTPPFGFLNPIRLLFFLVVYGGVALLCRELTVRSGKGWPTVILLGAAAGIFIEGLVTKSFFDPDWSALGQLGTYGRFFGVNWVWAVERTIQHAVFSVALPILLSHLLFPQRRQEPWLRGRSLVWLLGSVLAMAAAGFWFSSSYRPSFVPALVVLVLVMLLIGLAFSAPYTLKVTKNTTVADAYIFAALTFLGTLFFCLVNWLFPYTFIPAPLAVSCMLGLAYYVGRTVLQMSGNALKWGERHQFALAIGALAVYILLAPLQEWFPAGRDTRGMTMMALIAVLFLVGMGWQIRTRNVQQPLIGRTGQK